MDKWRFNELLKKEGFRTEKDASYPTVLVNGDKSVVAATYKQIKLLANKVGYTHSFGVKRSVVETEILDDPEVVEVDESVKEYVENMPDSKE